MSAACVPGSALAVVEVDPSAPLLSVSLVGLVEAAALETKRTNQQLALQLEQGRDCRDYNADIPYAVKARRSLGY